MNLESEVGKAPAREIEVTLFREILLVPFAIELRTNSDQVRGRRLMSDAAEALVGSDWKKQDDRLKHLPEDREPRPNVGDTRIRQLLPAYEEFVYFEPYVQRFLFGSPAERQAQIFPMRLFFRDDITHLEIEYPLDERPADRGPDPTDAQGGGEHASPRGLFRFSVDRCNLYLFETGNAILVLELAFEAKEVAEGASQRADLVLSDVQRILESLRRMFPPYFSPGDGRYRDPTANLDAPYFPRRFRWIATEGSPLVGVDVGFDVDAMVEAVFGTADQPKPNRSAPLFEPWRRLLEPLHVEGYEAADGPRVLLSQMGDDRAYVVAQVGVADASKIKRSDWVRLCYADAPGEGYPYGTDLLSTFEKDNCYDRFYEEDSADWKKTRFLICGYSLTLVGTCDAMPRVAEDDIDFFRNVLGKHIRRQYFQLALISFFQKIALLSLSERIADGLNNGDDGGSAFPASLQTIRKDALQFTHRYWFEDISAQLQAQELFDRLRNHLRTRALYQQINQEVGEATQQLELERQSQFADAAERLQITAAVGLVFAIAVGWFGMNYYGDDLQHAFWTKFASILGAFTVLLVGVYYVRPSEFRSKRRKK